MISSTPTKKPQSPREASERGISHSEGGIDELSQQPSTAESTESTRIDDPHAESFDLESLLGNSYENDSTQTIEPGEIPKATTAQKALMLTAVTLPIAGTAVAIAYLWQNGWMGWMYLAMMIGGWYITGMGITIGFHRLLTHRSFETIPVIRWFWTAAGSLAIQGSPLVWCAVHRRHHQLSDHHGDPHSPHLHEGTLRGILHGMFHAHMGWLFREYWEPPRPEKYVPDLLRDKMVMSVDKHYFKYVVASFVIPTVFAGLVTWSWEGALLGLLWGGFARVLLTQHITWSINSICHVFGSREYESGDHSTNNTFFGWVAHGEGWHNNHHAFPTSARHGLKWYQFDFSWVVIRTLEILGLAWSVKLPNERTLEKKRLAKPANS